VIRCIRKQIPGAEIHYLTKSSFREVIAPNPYLDKVFYLSDDLNGLLTALKRENYDYVIDLHHNLRTARVKQALGAKSFNFPKLNVRKWLLVHTKINLMPDTGIVDRYFEAVLPLGVRNDGLGLDYFIPEHTADVCAGLPERHRAGFVACVIGGTYYTKRLPVAKWNELCSLTPYPVVLLGGPEDQAAGELIAAVFPGRVYNACGKYSLNESARLIQCARVVVSNDTGLMHIAAAFQKPVISLWGNTTPAFGMFPYYGDNNGGDRPAPQSVIMENTKLSCHPCSKLGYNACPKGHFRCMNSLDMNQVASAIEAIEIYW
jgi:ADP-heptose:LPS heptosyltransferase